MKGAKIFVSQVRHEVLSGVVTVTNVFALPIFCSGHEHNLQHIHVSGASVHYVISGAGSMTDYPVELIDNGGSRFQHQGSGEHPRWTICTAHSVVVYDCFCGERLLLSVKWNMMEGTSIFGTLR